MQIAVSSNSHQITCKAKPEFVFAEPARCWNTIDRQSRILFELEKRREFHMVAKLERERERDDIGGGGGKEMIQAHTT